MFARRSGREQQHVKLRLENTRERLGTAACERRMRMPPGRWPGGASSLPEGQKWKGNAVDEERIG